MAPLHWFPCRRSSGLSSLPPDPSPDREREERRKGWGGRGRGAFFIARRYLFAPKSHSAINVISAVAVVGVAVATAAMVCILSVFNGFEETVASLFTAIDPPLKIVPAEGKYMAADDAALAALAGDADIAVCVETVEDKALLVVEGRQLPCTIKGVSDNYGELVDVDAIVEGDGIFQLHQDIVDYGIPGLTLLAALGLTPDCPPLQVYAPRGGERVNLHDPSGSFTQETLYSPRVALHVGQGKYDSEVVLTSIGFARRLFERQGYVTAVELRPAEGVNVSTLQRRLTKELGPRLRVLNRYEQQADTFRIMKVEKLISYAFLTFILLIASFNIISSLSMLIIDKRDDARVLRHLGATAALVRRIFFTEGQLITLAGALAGLLIGLVLCLLQQHFALISFGSSEGSYIISAYPVSVRCSDILLILITVLCVGCLSVAYAVRTQARRP